MSKEPMNLETLGTRAGFNSALRHIKKTIEVSESLGVKNLGDILHEMGDESFSGDGGALLLRMLLIDKLGYKPACRNLSAVSADVPALATEFAKWKGVDLVAAYHHPDLGLIIANPKIAEALASFGMLKKRELLVVYAGKGGATADESCGKAAELALNLFEGKKAKVPPELLKGGFAAKALKKPKEAKAHPSSPVKMTPRYSVPVSNELFHNGNVEAWKRIIASYNAKYPELQVFIYYEGERILDINTLFKWGKVKHGSSIQFAVSGTEIKDLAKLQRYLVQGSSSRFEAFLQGPVNTVIRLF